MLTITMPGLPVPWARAGRKGGMSFTPKKQKSAMLDLKVLAKDAMRGRPLFTAAVGVTMVFQYPWPASMSAKKRALSKGWRPSRPDVDNLMKLVGDGLNGIVWMDDGLIARSAISKVYGDCASTTITVEAL